MAITLLQIREFKKMQLSKWLIGSWKIVLQIRIMNRIIIIGIYHKDKRTLKSMKLNLKKIKKLMKISSKLTHKLSQIRLLDGLTPLSHPATMTQTAKVMKINASCSK